MKLSYIHGIILIIAILAGIYYYETERISKFSKSYPQSYKCEFSDNDSEEAIEHFSKVIQFETVSNPDAPDHALKPDAFEKLIYYLNSTYSLVFSNIQTEKVCKYSLIFTWHGKDKSLDPVMFISHMDVVPAPNDPLNPWKYPAFSGSIEEGFVWGRGSLDLKYSLVAILEAWTQLLKKKFQPNRTIIFAVGHDEEVGGTLGAKCISKILEERKIELDGIFDEGGKIADTGLPGLLDCPIAVIGTAEKGNLRYKIEVRSEGGHSSMPSADGSEAVSIMSKVLVDIDNDPFNIKLQQPMVDFLKFASPYTSNKFIRPILYHSDKWWPFNYIIIRKLLKDKTSASLIKTTSIVTNLNAGISNNVIPTTSTAILNFRLLPGIVESDIEAYLKKKFTHYTQNVTISKSGGFSNLASKVTPSKNKFFNYLSQAIKETMTLDNEEIIVLPFLLMGGTDSKNYQNLIKKPNVLRFAPFRKKISELSMIHGVNERASVDNFLQGICFYFRFTEMIGLEF